MKFWLIFCGAVELGIYAVADAYNVNILILELIKCIFFILVYIFMNIFMNIKKWEKDIKMKMNVGVSATLSSVLGAVSIIFFLKSETNVGWVVFLLIYIITIMCMLQLGKKIVFTDETENKKTNYRLASGITGGCIMSTLGFVRTASEKKQIVFLGMLVVVSIWVCLFTGVIVLIKCRDDLNEGLIKKEY